METEREVRRRVQARANAWRAVEGVKGGPADLKKTKGNGHDADLHACTEWKPWH